MGALGVRWPKLPLIETGLNLSPKSQNKVQFKINILSTPEDGTTANRAQEMSDIGGMLHFLRS